MREERSEMCDANRRVKRADSRWKRENRGDRWEKRVA